MSSDPLLQPYRLQHLALKNRLIITSHEPAYPEDGMPKSPLPRLFTSSGRGPGWR